MISLPHVVLLLVLTFAAIPLSGWLILVCADFLSLDDCLAPAPGWTFFAFVIALSLTLPPVLHGWPDLTRSARLVARETARAVLLSFALFAVVFLLGARTLFGWFGLPDIMLPMTAMVLAPLFSCPVQYVSYAVAVKLLPRPGPTEARPRAMQVFAALSLLLVLVLMLHGFVLPAEHARILSADKPGLIAAIWRFAALRHVIAACGNAGFAPAWGGCCLVFGIDVARALPGSGAAEPFVMILLLALMLASVVCLLLPSSRRWLC